MSIIINGRKFSGYITDTLIQNIIKEINQLPSPEIKYMHQAPLVKNDEIGLCLQGEAIYINEFDPANTIRYIGSKKVYDCIMAYFHSETDHLTLHYDGANGFNLVNLLNNFVNKESISISLVGGLVNERKNVSEIKLHKLIKLIYLASEELNINIKITHQKIMDRNTFSAEDKYRFIFDEIIESATILYRQIFKKDLDIQLFSTKQLNDFTTINADPKDVEQLSLIAHMIPLANEIYDIKIRDNLNEVFKMFNEEIKSEENFLYYIDKLFSIGGFILLDKIFTHRNYYPPNKLTNTVFDIKTGDGFIVSAHLKTPNEIIRSLASMDKDYRTYVMCFDNKTRTYVQTALSPRLLQALDLFNPYLSGIPMINKAAIAEKIGFTVGTLTQRDVSNLIYRFLRMKRQHAMHSLVTNYQCTIFHSFKKLNDYYLNEDIVHQNLNLLNALTNRHFTAKKRYTPQNTVDALLFCDKPDQAQAVQALLEEKHISSTLVKFNHEIYVCVHAINVGQYAKAIESSMRCAPHKP